MQGSGTATTAGVLCLVLEILLPPNRGQADAHLILYCNHILFVDDDFVAGRKQATADSASSDRTGGWTGWARSGHCAAIPAVVGWAQSRVLHVCSSVTQHATRNASDLSMVESMPRRQCLIFVCQRQENDNISDDRI